MTVSYHGSEECEEAWKFHLALFDESTSCKEEDGDDSDLVKDERELLRTRSISDRDKGLLNAAEEVLGGDHFKCHVHVLRNAKVHAGYHSSKLDSHVNKAAKSLTEVCHRPFLHSEPALFPLPGYFFFISTSFSSFSPNPNPGPAHRCHLLTTPHPTHPFRFGSFFGSAQAGLRASLLAAKAEAGGDKGDKIDTIIEYLTADEQRGWALSHHLGSAALGVTTSNDVEVTHRDYKRKEKKYLSFPVAYAFLRIYNDGMRQMEVKQASFLRLWKDVCSEGGRGGVEAWFIGPFAESLYGRLYEEKLTIANSTDMACEPIAAEAMTDEDFLNPQMLGSAVRFRVLAAQADGVSVTHTVDSAGLSCSCGFPSTYLMPCEHVHSAATSSQGFSARDFLSPRLSVTLYKRTVGVGMAPGPGRQGRLYWNTDCGAKWSDIKSNPTTTIKTHGIVKKKGRPRGPRRHKSRGEE
jgi:hypothetical protein